MRRLTIVLLVVAVIAVLVTLAAQEDQKRIGPRPPYPTAAP